MYKHQWVVVKAIGHLRSRGYNIELTLAGGGSGRACVDCSRKRSRAPIPSGCSSNAWDFVQHDDLPGLLADANLFVFASSCENMPNTLVEAMAIGLADRVLRPGPMPEVLRDGGVYFDPEDCASIANAIETSSETQSLECASRTREGASRAVLLGAMRGRKHGPF